MLPPFLTPRVQTELVRIGRNNDGGYVIAADSIPATGALVGLGLSDDWSFEAHFQKLQPVPVTMYDHTVTGKFWLKQFARELSHGRWPFRYVEYLAFFARAQNRHVRQKIGYKGLGSIDLDGVLADMPPDQRVFLKIDIEGAEYRILDQIVAHQHRLSGAMIEFHAVDLHVDKLAAFVDEFALPLVHTHANNYAGVAPDGLPMVLELSFKRPAPDDRPVTTVTLPIAGLDQPNNPRTADIPLAGTG